MTIFGWDASHFDGLISDVNAAHARAQGIDFVTHKLTEGSNYVDPNVARALAAFRSADFPAIGVYHVVRSGDVAAQVAFMLAQLTKAAPWWKTFPGFFLQVDLETWDYDRVPASTGVGFGKLLRAQAKKCTIMYASHGEYGDQLTDWDGPLWNANYRTSTAGPFRTLYPGDGYAGFSPYSGQTPLIAQYSSKATIGDLTTCDANAYRGTLDQLLTLITGGSTMDLTPQNLADIAHSAWYTKNLPSDTPTETPATALLQAQLKAIDAARDAAAALVQSRTNGSSLSTLSSRVDSLDGKLSTILSLLQGGAAPGSISDADVHRIAVADADETAQRQQS
jgi:GH25 family lysozyme M1 (1,4-beta-N-acetylmuramidase)